MLGIINIQAVAQSSINRNIALIEEFDTCYQKMGNGYNELVNNTHVFNSFGFLTRYAVVNDHPDRGEPVGIEGMAAKKMISGHTLTEEATIITEKEALAGAPLLGHALLSRNILSIQTGIGLMGGFALTIVKNSNSLSVTYYEYADGEKVFKTLLSQQWNESITMPMQVQEATAVERVEDGRPAIYIKMRVCTAPYYYKLPDISENNYTSRQVTLECLLRCFPEQVPGGKNGK